MSKKITKPFRFKRFEVQHAQSAHKVGVDGVLVGLLAPVPSSTEYLRILDVGCGCGIISLILAQRLVDLGLDFYVTALDIDSASVFEAERNFLNSDWASHLCSVRWSFDGVPAGAKLDLVVSNPPYFDAGVTNPETRREVARHNGELSPETLIDRSPEILRENGRLAMIVPADRCEELIERARSKNLSLTRRIDVRGHASAPIKRAVLDFTLCSDKAQAESAVHTAEHSLLTLETAPGVPTEEYRQLGKDFYLYF